MMSKHKSDSSEQRIVERCMLRKMGLAHQTKQPTLHCGAQVKLDGFDEKQRVLCEVYAHIGPLKPGQVRKIASDILKMLLVENDLGGCWRKIYYFAKEVPQELRGNSWLKHTAKQFHVELKPVQLPKQTVALLTRVQRRQAKSINPGIAG